jgi:hypothetical protein
MHTVRVMAHLPESSVGPAAAAGASYVNVTLMYTKAVFPGGEWLDVPKKKGPIQANLIGPGAESPTPVNTLLKGPNVRSSVSGTKEVRRVSHNR